MQYISPGQILFIIFLFLFLFPDGSLGEMHLLPEPLFNLPTDSTFMQSIAGTESGRIFMGGKDGCLYEFAYKVRELSVLLPNEEVIVILTFAFRLKTVGLARKRKSSTTPLRPSRSSSRPSSTRLSTKRTL